MEFQSIRKVLSRSPLGKLYRLRHRLRSPQQIFTEVYQKRAWNSPESASGLGSTLEHTQTLRRVLPRLLEELGIKTMLDAPCGDLNWMRQTNLNLEKYFGVDIVQEIISANNLKYKRADREFMALNIVADPLPRADMILCRDAFVHFRYNDIFKAVENFKRSGAKYLLTTTFPGRINEDLEFTGMFRVIDLQAPPFSFPPPLRLINEESTEYHGAFPDKSLGLWELSSL